jgi:hypothetical protein
MKGGEGAFTGDFSAGDSNRSQSPRAAREVVQPEEFRGGRGPCSLDGGTR